MANLPIELWHLIFDHLQLTELSSCAQVSKAVYLVVKAYRIREIAFTRRVYKWFHYTTPTIDHKHRLDFTMASILKRSSFDFDHLKHLKIGQSSVIDLDVINRFVHLEELDIDLKNYENEKSRTLSLANLKVLYLFVPDRIPYVELDTPLLAKAYTVNLENLEFFFPESVRCIHTFLHSGKLSMFRNLEYLALTDFYNQLDLSSYGSKSFKDFSVKVLKKLKELYFYFNNDKYAKENMSVFKRVTAKLLERPGLKVFWYDVQMTDPNLLTEYERMDQTVGSLLTFQLQHYKMLKEKVHFFWLYGFNRGSIRKLSIARFNVRSEEFTSKLFSRYSFRRINVTFKVEEPEFLLEPIARSSNLFNLRFSNSGLDQSFFDRMADIVRLNGIPLRQLRVMDTENESLDFDFVCTLRDLELFKTDLELSPKLIAKLPRLLSLVQFKRSSWWHYCNSKATLDQSVSE